jgi:hypothetical protein
LACRNDAKTVSIIEFGCFHPVIKVQSASLHFFLASDDDQPDSDEEEDDVSTLGIYHRVHAVINIAKGARFESSTASANNQQKDSKWRQETPQDS